MPKRWCASITSKPLFISVAESIVIRPPIFQVGWSSASATLTSPRSPRPRKGPPEAVMTRRSTVPGASRPISWWSAECSESTGRSRAPVASASAITSSPPSTQLPLFAKRACEPHPQLAAEHQPLLVGERDVDPGRQRGDGRAEAGGADDPVQHEVGLGRRDQVAHALLADQHPPVPRLARAGGSVGIGERGHGGVGL